MQPERNGNFNPLDEASRNERLHAFSHALKNRLGSIWQAAAMLAGLPEGPEREQLLAMAEKNYFAGARELEDLMEDFTVPRGIGTLRPEPFEPVALLERCIRNVDFRTVKKGQEIRFTPNELPASITGDKQVLEQLIEALLSNASKFSPKGAPIELNAWSDAGNWIVEVIDHGVGLSATDLDKVFTRYAMLSSRSTDGESQARSTLARAKQWAEAHGGKLTASSPGPGAGASFRMVVPLDGKA